MINNKELNQKLLEISKYKRNVNSSTEEYQKINLCCVVLEALINLKEERQYKLPFSFRKHVEGLSKYINSNNISDDVSYLICATFLKEFYLYLNYIDDNLDDYKSILIAWSDFESSDYDIRGNNDYNREYYEKLKSDDLLEFFYISLSAQKRNFESQSKELESIKEKGLKEISEREVRLSKGLEIFDKEITKLENTTTNLASLLETQKTDFNFVGLSKGFQNILQKKTYAKWMSLALLALITLFMFVIFGLYHYFLPNESTEIFDFWKFSMPYFGLEFVSLYLFRVVLKHYNSIQTQIMQIELRQSLCQFIQSYADYAKEIKEKNGASLDKFENLIFSSIVSTSEQVPSTFDGLEHITNLIKSAKS